MQMVYNSDSFAVVAVDLADGGFEIVDKFARKGIFIAGAVAQGFQQGVAELVQRGPSEEELDDFIASYATLAQQPLVVH